MAHLDLVQDYGVPAAVGLGELALRAYDRSRLMKNPSAMEFEPLLPYALAIGGTAARVTNFMPGRDETIRMVVAASMPRVLTGIYDWATTGVGILNTGRKVRRLTARRVGDITPAPPTPSYTQGGYRSL